MIGSTFGYARQHRLLERRSLALRFQSQTWENIEQQNGYKGAIDPAPYWNGFLTADAQTIIQQLFPALIITLKGLVELVGPIGLIGRWPVLRRSEDGEGQALLGRAH